MKGRGLILGADGGGSKTHVALADEKGRLRAFVEGASTNHENHGFAAVRRAFADIVSRALRQAGATRGDIRAACYGLAGNDIPEDAPQIYRNAIRPLGLSGKTAVFNDAFIPLFNDRFRTKGMVVTAGAGQKWLGINGARTHMIEGFGIGNIRDLAAAEGWHVGEGVRPSSPFTRALVRHLGFKSEWEFTVRWGFGGSKRAYVKPVKGFSWERYRTLPEFVAGLAAKGDRDALKVCDAYARELMVGARGIVRTLSLGGRYEIVLSGSVLAGIPALRRAFARRVRSIAPGARIIGTKARPIRGALNYAFHMAGWQLPSGALAERELWYPGTRP
jgi:N-acetylglucosamine kinase-like BadF-type ATPase